MTDVPVVGTEEAVRTSVDPSHDYAAPNLDSAMAGREDGSFGFPYGQHLTYPLRPGMLQPRSMPVPLPGFQTTPGFQT